MKKSYTPPGQGTEGDELDNVPIILVFIIIPIIFVGLALLSHH